MNITTGQTIFELIRSYNPNTNLPIVPANFDYTIYTNGIVNTGMTADINISNTSEGIYIMSWSASTYGTYQIHVDNTTTNVIYISEIYNVKSDSEINPSPTIYVGL